MNGITLIQVAQHTLPSNFRAEGAPLWSGLSTRPRTTSTTQRQTPWQRFQAEGWRAVPQAHHDIVKQVERLGRRLQEGHQLSVARVLGHGAHRPHNVVCGCTARSGMGGGAEGG